VARAESAAAAYKSAIDKLIRQAWEDRAVSPTWQISFLEKAAANLFDAMSAARQFGVESITNQLSEQSLATAGMVNFAFDVRNIKAESRLRAIAFYVAGVENQELLDTLQDALEQAMREGQTFADFQDAAHAAYETAGVTPTSRWHLELVYRNNLQTSYNAGRWDALTAPVMVKEFPLWEYNAILDGATRPAHRAMNGKRYAPDDPIWDEWYPPNGHACRCSVSAISVDEVAEDNLQPDNKVPDTVRPDKGWDTNPAKNLKQFKKWAENKFAEMGQV